MILPLFEKRREQFEFINCVNQHHKHEKASANLVKHQKRCAEVNSQRYDACSNKYETQDCKGGYFVSHDGFLSDERFNKPPMLRYVDYHYEKPCPAETAVKRLPLQFHGFFRVGDDEKNDKSQNQQYVDNYF